jgi:hypothetical protein
MGEKLEFGDFYKFITSIGIGLLVLAFAIPWAFLREDFDLRLTGAELQNIPIESKAIIERRWHLDALIFAHLPATSVALAVIGLLLLAFGCFGWWKRQRVRDDLETWTAQKTKMELESMTKSQILASAGAEVQASVEEIQAESDPSTEPTVEPTAVSSYIALEERVGARLKECLARMYDVLSQQRLGAAFFDFILRSRDGQGSDVVIELKARPKHFNTNVVLTGLRQAAIAAQSYAAALYRKPTPLLLLVVSEGSGSANALRDRVIQIRSLDSTLGGVKVWVISESEFFSADCNLLFLYFSAALLAS